MTPRKPVQRAFHGMVGRPYEPDEPAPAPIPVAEVDTPKPVVVPPVSDGSCDYRPYNSLPDRWQCARCTFISMETTPQPRACPALVEREKIIDKKLARAEARAKAARVERKAKRDKRAAIKELLKTPIAEIKAAIAAAKEAERLPSMSEGKYLKGAPFGTGALIFKSGNKIEQIGAAISRGEALGSETIDEDGQAFFPDNDRTRVAPEGIGAASDEKPTVTGLSRRGFTYHSEERTRRFSVKLTGPEYQNGLSLALKECTDENICKLCQQEFDRIEAHFELVHGDPLEPTHDEQWGDLVQKYVRKFKRGHAQLEKAGRKIALEQAANERTKAALEATRGGFEEVWVGGKREWVKS